MSTTVGSATNGAAAGAKSAKLSKNAMRRAKKKAEKQAGTSAPQATTNGHDASDEPVVNGDAAHTAVKQEVEAVPHTNGSARETDGDAEMKYEDFGDNDDPLLSQYKDIFAKFTETSDADPTQQESTKPEIFYDDDNDDIPDEEEVQEATMSKKKRKAMTKLTVAELKALVRRPELVEWTDTSAPDPRLLISIKSGRNVVPVPTHWSLKREYLSSKRGIQKPHWSLPKFIADTGISEMRDAALAKEADKTMKQKQRDRVAPKTGKLDIDYQKLYEAFFKHQTKPEMTRYGEVYYEGKEYETNLRHLRPGDVSDELQRALGMAPGGPPPWLVAMQRNGPPRAYPQLKIPGVNAAIPPGSSWGYEPNQWGRPPVDQYNRPLYGGDIFGSLTESATTAQAEPVDRTRWGELQEREEEEEEEEEEEDEEEDEAEEEEEAAPAPRARRPDPSGLQSAVPTEIGGVESIAGDFTLRKDVRPRGGRGTESELPSAPRTAGTVLQERSAKSTGFFGSERGYDIPSSSSGPTLDSAAGGRGQKRKAGDVEVAVDVEQLGEGMSKREMERLYEAGRQQEAQWKGAAVGSEEDLGDMVAEEGRKRLKKDQEDRDRRRQGKR